VDHKNLDPHRSSGCKASSLTAEPEEGPGVGQLDLAIDDKLVLASSSSQEAMVLSNPKLFPSRDPIA